jgi:APA family basic amino acid/polyamine antiporter
MVAAFATSLVWISLSYSGFNAAVYVAEEAKDATRGVPRALLIGTLAVIVLYVLLNAIFAYAPPPDRIAGQEDIAAIAANWLGGPRVEGFVRAIICLALLTSVFSMVMAAPRVYAKMADDGFFPQFMKFRGGAPRWAITSQVGLAAIFVLISDLQGLLTYLGLTLSLCAAASVACLLLPSMRRRPLLHVSHLPAIIYVTCTVGAGAIMAAAGWKQLLGTVATVLVGALAYVLVRRAAPAR